MSNSGVRTINDLYDVKNNAFDITRFVLALMVIYSHSYPIFFGAALNGGDILARLSSHQIDFGTIAIRCFFIISGFLITQSLLNSKGYLEYFVKRSLRIFPALIASALLSALIIGPLLTNLSMSEYFNNQVFRYILDTITLNATGFHSTINDLFATNIFPSAINGSAWSLKHEFACYILLAILYFFHIFKHRSLVVVATVVALILVLINMRSGFVLYRSDFWTFIEPDHLTRFIYYFLAGSMMYVYKEKIVYSDRLLILVFLVILLAAKLMVLEYVMLFCLPYLLISFCLRVKFSAFRKFGDFSYGMYIYAFPIQQTVMFLLADKINLISFFIISSISTFVIAFLSWKYIEEPSLKLKSKILIGKAKESHKSKAV